ncbi:KRAB-A domain-containing protein 2-like [Palaemon carinicauda]|uniref:KRAB-A domain-containing protein 2-like n=1 Tax=Palaemon carinicauda TaxID=392227 RepID=UPI0035B68DD1
MPDFIASALQTPEESLQEQQNPARGRNTPAQSSQRTPVGPTEKLIKRCSTRQESPLYSVSIKEMFDIVKSAHISTGHGGRDRMLKELQKKYANIQTKAVELFKSLCQECQKKQKRPMTKGVVVRPILIKKFSSRGQVDLIDMQSMPSGSNKKWIMVYQDLLMKFCLLRALTSRRAAEVAFHLLDIFLLFGAPVILQSDNDLSSLSKSLQN